MQIKNPPNRIVRILSIICVANFVLFLLFAIMESPPPTQIVTKIETIASVGTESPLTSSRFYDLNRRLNDIPSFHSSECYVSVWEKGIKLRLRGELYYEKPDRFRLMVRSRLGEELDLGSNETVFWYWSRRDPKPGLYYAKYEDFSKTRLKTPFNPIWMRGALGLDPVDEKNARLVENGDSLLISQLAESSTGKPILNCTLIENGDIKAKAVTDVAGNMLASSEILERFSDGCPKSILFTWHEENKTMLMEFQTSTMGGTISASKWFLPENEPRIDMGVE